MSSDGYPLPDVEVESVPPRQLWEDLRSGNPTTILDVRSSSEYEEWHLAGEAVSITNIPYYEFIEGVSPDLLDSVPVGDPLVVVCAKGGASNYVAGVLKEEGREAVNLAEGMNGWAEIYEAVELGLGTESTIIQYQRPSSGCLGYLVIHDGEAAVFDPLRHFSKRYEADATAYDALLTTVVDTHIHADHLSGLRRVAKEAGATTILPKPAMARGVTDAVDREIEDGETFDVGGITIEAIHAPGHTTGMTAFLIEDRVLLTGDSLFVESVARPDLERGSSGERDFAETLYDTLNERILTLPNDTVVAPGHVSDAATPEPDGSYTSTIGDLTDSMTVLGMDREAFVSFILADMPPRPANYASIIEANLGTESVDDEEAFRLELGPNNCAASTGALTGD